MLRRRPWLWMALLMASVGMMITAGHGGTTSQPPSRPQVGIASWYGPGFHGRKTASGERMRKQHFTAAHRTLPLGTKVLVINPQTKAKVEVRINDRGPRPKNRLIDLSQAAAEHLGIVEQGLARVQVVVSEPSIGRSGLNDEVFHVVQVRALANREQAKVLRARVRAKYPQTYMTAHRGPFGTYYRVRVGPFQSEAQSQQAAELLTRRGHNVFVDRVTRSTLEARGVSIPEGYTPRS